MYFLFMHNQGGRLYIHTNTGQVLCVLLWLLKEELETLWKTPANTWDAAEKEYFPMRAALLTTVHDYLGYGYLAGQVVPRIGWRFPQCL